MTDKEQEIQKGVTLEDLTRKFLYRMDQDIDGNWDFDVVNGYELWLYGKRCYTAKINSQKEIINICGGFYDASILDEIIIKVV